MSEQDELLLTPKELSKLPSNKWRDGRWCYDPYEIMRALLAKVKQHYEQKIEKSKVEWFETGAASGRLHGVKSVIDYLKNEIATQDKRTAGEPKLKAHLNAVEKVVLQTVINALEEWLNE